MSTRLTSHKLQFLDPTFPNGVSITIRNGPKWSRRVVPGMVVMIEDSNGNECGEATIVGALHTTFDAIPDKIIEQNHRTRQGLFEEMQAVYPSFETTNEVTVLFFTFTKGAGDVGE